MSSTGADFRRRHEGFGARSHDCGPADGSVDRCTRRKRHRHRRRTQTARTSPVERIARMWRTPGVHSGVTARGDQVPAGPGRRITVGPLTLKVDVTDLEHRAVQCSREHPGQAGPLTLVLSGVAARQSRASRAHRRARRDCSITRRRPPAWSGSATRSTCMHSTSQSRRRRPARSRIPVCLALPAGAGAHGR